MSSGMIHTMFGRDSAKVHKICQKLMRQMICFMMIGMWMIMRMSWQNEKRHSATLTETQNNPESENFLLARIFEGTRLERWVPRPCGGLGMSHLAKGFHKTMTHIGAFRSESMMGFF